MLYPIDIYYLVLVVPALIIAMIAQAKVQTTFKKYNLVYAGNGKSASQIAREILDSNGLYHIRIEQVGGHLTDHYDPKAGVIRLSQSVYNSSSIASIGVAAHEVGHAIQKSVNYFPIKIRNFILPGAQIGSYIAIPLAMLGLFFGNFLLQFGIVLFAATVLFQIVTLPVEFNASKRAIEIIEQNNYLLGEDVTGAKKVLSAAALTYVAAALVAIMNLLRLILIARDRRD